MKIEIRDNVAHLDGYVNVVGRESRILPSPRGKFIEEIVPKTFDKALSKGNNVDLLFNHRENRKLGSISEGNLELHEDSIGLRAKCTVSDVEVIEKARKGELRGWSFSFISRKDTWKEGEDGIQRRYVEDLDLLEVSILDKTPAYIATSIEERGEESIISEQRNEFAATEVNEIDKTKDEEEEKREEPVNYSLFENEIEILKLKGGK